jgi:hypothetical protein
MKKILLFALFLVGFSQLSHAQFAGKSGSEKSGGFFSGMFRSSRPHKQMNHFDSQKSDPNMKNNGTSYRRDRKRDYVVDGDGFGTAKQGKSKGRRRKK